jgi:hypothetical protein
MIMATRARLAACAVAALLTATILSVAGAAANVTKPGGTGARKDPGIHGPLHGPGSTHNPVVRHPPLHGAGSSHNPIVVPRDCNGPNTLCRRP